MTRKVTIALLTLAALLSVASTASAKGGGQTVSGTCTGTSTSTLKVHADDGRLEVEFEVDSNVRRQSWSVNLKDNGSTFFQRTLKTKGRSGSFEARAKPADLSGTDTIQATATNGATGENCSATLGV